MEIEKNNIYWFFVLFGILLVIIIYYRGTYVPTTGVEYFTTAGAAAAGAGAAAAGGAGAAGAGAAGAGAAAGAAAAATMVTNSLVYYFQLFNLATNTTFGNNPGSVTGASLWLNTTPSLTPDTVSGNTLSVVPFASSIVTNPQGFSPGLPTIGLPIQSSFSSKALLGPTSTSDVLGSFSIVFYAKFNSLTFTNTNPLPLYEAFAETPNAVKLLISPKSGDTNNVYVQLLLGNFQTAYNWLISIDTLKAGGNPTLYALTFDNSTPATPNAIFYIGTTANTIPSMTPINSSVLLGYSPIRINTSGNLDMNLFAIAYYTSSLAPSDIANLSTYFLQQYTGVIAATAAAALTAQQNAALASTVDANALALANLQNQINQCEANLSLIKVTNNKPLLPPDSSGWHVNNPKGNNPVSPQDMEKCDVLKIKKAMNSISHAQPSINAGLLSNVAANNNGIGTILDPTKGQFPTPQDYAQYSAQNKNSRALSIAQSTTQTLLANQSAQAAQNAQLQAEIAALQQQQNAANNNSPSFQQTYQQLAQQAYQNPGSSTTTSILTPTNSTTVTTSSTGSGSGSSSSSPSSPSTTIISPDSTVNIDNSAAQPQVAGNSFISSFYTALGF
uniref:Uncharacterized protein n=1 Tax=viral metagenome TaxID=1070528 RepID=A0A6C0KWJ3_9ZZZZ